MRGLRVSAHDAVDSNAVLEGTVEGVSSSGSLLLRVGPSLHLVSSGEVTLRMVGNEGGPALG